MLGLSDSTGDVRDLLAAAVTDPRAGAAIDSFVASVAKQVAAFTTVLGGLDMLVFTGGIGAGSATIRAAVASRLAHLGVEIDGDRNKQNREVISPQMAGCSVLVVTTDEESVIASQALRVASS
jgi:acetate kinase